MQRQLFDLKLKIMSYVYNLLMTLSVQRLSWHIIHWHSRSQLQLSWIHLNPGGRILQKCSFITAHTRIPVPVPNTYVGFPVYFWEVKELEKPISVHLKWVWSLNGSWRVLYVTGLKRVSLHEVRSTGLSSDVCKRNLGGWSVRWVSEHSSEKSQQSVAC